MADGTAIGYGIGKGLEQLGEALNRRFQGQSAEREKQADALHSKGVQIATNLLQKGYSTRHDPQGGGPVLIDANTGQLAANAPADITGLFDELVTTSKQARQLFPANEPNSIAQHFRKFLGKTPAQSTPNPRAAQYSAPGFAAEVPAQPDKTLETLNSIRRQIESANPNVSPQERAQLFTQAVNSKLGIGQQDEGLTAHGAPQEGKDANGQPVMLQEFVDKSGNITTKQVPGLNPPAPAVPKENKWDTSPVSGGPLGVFDPNTGKHYDANTITTASPELQSEWKSREDYAKKINDQKEASELKKVQEAEAREDKRYANQAKLQANAFANAFAQKDYAAAESIRKNAEDKYTKTKGLAAFADLALQHKEAAQDKLLAGRLIRESEGRFNPAQYDNLVKNAGLANTFEQWINNVESGKLTDPMRQQLVNAAHALMDSDKTALDSLAPPATPGDLKQKANPKGASSGVDDILSEIENLAKKKK